MHGAHGATTTRTLVDPFYLFLDLVAALAPGQVFLLDAAQDDTSVPYRMSLIGALPVLEIQVKEGRVALVVESGLGLHLRAQLMLHGHQAVEFVPGMFVPSSVIDGETLFFEPRDPMALLDDIRRVVRSLVDAPGEQPPFTRGLLGYLGYDAAHYLEQLPKSTQDDRGVPDIRLQWHAALVQMTGREISLFDSMSALQGVMAPAAWQRLSERLERVKRVLTSDPGEMENRLGTFGVSGDVLPPDVRVTEDVSQADYEASIRRAQQYIQAGDIFQVVLSKRMRIEKRLHHYDAYERLRRLNPSPYMFVAEYPDMRLFGASPEVQFRAVNGVAEMKPIAGTSKGRGQSKEEDMRLQQQLLDDEKECAEHLMLVDLCRNDLGRVCAVGSVHVAQFMTVEPYSHLFHLVSTVRGQLRPDVNVFHALLATFPAGTLSGAPKIRAMEIIDELEIFRRGPYGGLLGMVDFDANANTAIIIRTVVEVNDEYYVQVGAGIVADSDPAQEWLECGHKAGAVVDVLTGRR